MPQSPTPAERAVAARLATLERMVAQQSRSQQQIWTDPTGAGGDLRPGQTVAPGGVAVAGYLTPVCSIDGIQGFGIAVFDEVEQVWCQIECTDNDAVCGVAWYEKREFSGSYATTFTVPDYTSFGPQTAGVGPPDTIGIIRSINYLGIPPNWKWECNVLIQLEFETPPPTGEAVIWGAAGDQVPVDIWGPDARLDRVDVATGIPTFPIEEGGQSFSGMVAAITPSLPNPFLENPSAGLIALNEVSTYLGTPFRMLYIRFLFTGLTPFGCSTALRGLE